jgi:hypothetical protein
MYIKDKSVVAKVTRMNRIILLMKSWDIILVHFFPFLNINMKVSQTMKLGLVLGGVVLLAFVMNNYSGMKGMMSEGLSMDKLSDSVGVRGPLSDSPPMSASTHLVGGNSQPVESLKSRHPASQGTYTENSLSSSELLPKGSLGASFAAVNPGSMDDLKGQNLLQAGYHTNTAVAGVSQTFRNPSWDVRAEHPNPQGQTTTGPWNQSTIETDSFRKGIDA